MYQGLVYSIQSPLDYIRDLVEIVAERLSMCSLLLITHIVQKLVSLKISFSEINEYLGTFFSKKCPTYTGAKNTGTGEAGSN